MGGIKIKGMVTILVIVLVLLMQKINSSLFSIASIGENSLNCMLQYIGKA